MYKSIANRSKIPQDDRVEDKYNIKRKESVVLVDISCQRISDYVRPVCFKEQCGIVLTTADNLRDNEVARDRIMAENFVFEKTKHQKVVDKLYMSLQHYKLIFALCCASTDTHIHLAPVQVIDSNANRNLRNKSYSILAQKYVDARSSTNTTRARRSLYCYRATVHERDHQRHWTFKAPWW